MAKQVGYFLLLLALTFFVTLGGGMYGVHEFRLGFLSHLVAISILLGYGLCKLRQGRLLPRTPLDLPLLGFLLVNLLSTILSRDARLSAETLLYLSVLVLVYYVSVDALSNGWPYLTMVKTLLMVGSVVLLLALLELGAWYFGLLHLLIPGDVPPIGWFTIGGLSLPPTLYRLHITLSNSNALAWFVALLIPLAVGQFLATTRVRTKVNLVAWIGLASFVLILTFSRGGLIALVMGLATLGFLYLAPRAGRNASRVRRAMPVWLVVIVLMAIASLPVMLWLVGWRYATVGVRLELWQAAVAILARYPILGGGPGTFGYLFHQVADFSPQSPDIFFNSAHNAYLNMLAETGIPGLVFGLWLVGALLLVGWRKCRYGTDIHGRPLSLREVATIAGCTAGLVGLVVVNLIDNCFVFPSITVIAILYAAIVVHPDAKPGLPTRKPAVLTLAIMVTLTTLWIDVAHYFYAQGVAAAQKGDWLATAGALERAQDLDPAFALYHFHWGIAQGYLGLQGNGDPVKLQQAIDEYRREISRGGHYALNFANLAWLEFRAGQMASALADMEQAVSLAPLEARYRLSLAFLAESAGDQEKALAQYAQAVALQPAILDYAFWHASSFRQEALDQLPSLALSYVPPSADKALTRATLAYYAGELDTARTALESLSSPEALVLLASIERKAGDDRAATVYLDRALGMDRGFGPAYLERGKIHLAAQQWELAEEDLRMALFLGVREAHYHLGELAFQQGQLEVALREFSEGLSWSCSIPMYLYHYASDVYHRENLPADFSPSVLECMPRDGLLPIYAHLTETYSETGARDKAKDVCNWLLEFYPPLFLKERIGDSCEAGNGTL